MLHEARRYIEMGYSVIPLRPGNKEPLIKWQEFTQRKATDAELLEWFGSGENNIGIVTGGASGFVVVDVDGEDGLVSANQLSLESSTIALTGKGRQYFYRPPPMPLRNAVRLLPGIDIRSDGGYVCAPPSIHPNGKRYTWLIGPTAELPDFPSTLMNYVTKESTPSISQSSPISGWLSEALKSLAEGNRNDTFARVVGKLHHSGLDKAAIWSLLLPHARTCGFTDKELNGVIQSISKYPAEMSASASASSIESFLADSSPVAWLCDSICARGSIGFAAGLPETYKTWLLMDLAIECARGGGLWLGLFPVVGGRVLFIDQERAKGETQRRFNLLLTGKSISRSGLTGKLFVRAGTSTKIDNDESYHALKAELADIRPDLVIVDSFAAFHTSEENDRMAIQKVLERVKDLRNEFGCAIIFIDHENKSVFSDQMNDQAPSAFRMVGSVGKPAAAEFVLTVRRYDPTTCMVYHTKSTQGPRVPSFTVNVEDIPTGGIKVYGQGGK